MLKLSPTMKTLRMYKVKQKHISSIEDFKGAQGLWVKSYTVPTEGLQTIYHTRSSVVWRSLINRCKLSIKYPSYADCEIKYEGYQEFTEWCQSQHGYMNKNPNGTFWQLDKDLKVEGNRIYSPEFCLFVPSRVNCLFNIKSSNNNLPAGVSMYANSDYYGWGCGDGKNKLWGTAPDPMSAHRGWQKAKIGVIENILTTEKYGDQIDEIILTRLNKLKYEYVNGLETKHFRYDQENYK